FTVDAFTGFGTSSDLLFGYDDVPDEYSIPGVDVTSIPALPVVMNAIPYQTADNAWLATL
ncbi:MAG: hypothetical protein AAGG75_21240, partial [Bacteroidota bacterium]